MRNSLLTLTLASAAILGAVAGASLQSGRDAIAQENAWNGVLVVSKAGTLVANPSALTPAQLASYTIVNPMDNLTICTDRKGQTFVNPTDDECQDFKSIRRL